MNESITLNLVEGNSAKTYQAQLEASGSGFVVNFQYGRIGSTLKAGTKTAAPVDYAAAKRAYDALVKSKTSKGYSPTEGGQAYQGTENAGRVSGQRPQLLNAIDEAQVQALILDPAWGCEIKADGERRMLQITDGEVIGTNRRGLVVAASEAIADAALQGGFKGTTTLDGEDMGGVLVVFDVLMHEGVDLTQRPYRERIEMRELVYARAPALGRIETATSTLAKRLLVEQARADGQEGVVFKRLDAPYTPDRPNTGGDALKFKFVADATVRVRGQNGTKRSVEMELMADDGSWVGVGNVTIPANAAIPAAGELIEVRYLYGYRGGSLFQPVYQRARRDLTEDACTVKQVKYKGEPEALAA